MTFLKFIAFLKLVQILRKLREEREREREKRTYQRSDPKRSFVIFVHSIDFGAAFKQKLDNICMPFLQYWLQMLSCILNILKKTNTYIRSDPKRSVAIIVNWIDIGAFLVQKLDNFQMPFLEIHTQAHITSKKLKSNQNTYMSSQRKRSFSFIVCLINFCTFFDEKLDNIPLSFLYVA